MKINIIHNFNTMCKKFYILLIISYIATNCYAQNIETVVANKQYTYKVEGFGIGALLYWEITGGKILSANPTPTDTVLVEWHTIGKQQLSVY